MKLGHAVKLFTKAVYRAFTTYLSRAASFKDAQPLGEAAVLQAIATQ